MKRISKIKVYQKKVSDLKKDGLFLNIKTISSPLKAKVKVDGKWVVNLCSNNYLGLANRSEIKKAVIQAVSFYGVSLAAVRTISGTGRLHLELEKRLAEFKKVESVIVFASGFVTNLSVIPALVGEGDVIFSDELNHASIIDGCRLSKAQIIKYNHSDMNDLSKKLKMRKKFRQALIVTDGVFSMDGDIAPLPEICKMANDYDCLVMVDDAHGEGVLGDGGRGIVDHFNLHGKVDIEVGTLSKAFGVVGGYAAGRKEYIEWLKQRARGFLFSSSATIADTAACIKALEIVSREKTLIKKLWENTFYFKEKMLSSGFDIGKSQTPIIPVILKDEKITQKFAKMLFDNGVFAVPITYPTVAKGKARIRTIVTAAHSKSDLDISHNAFVKVGRKLGLI